MFAKLKRIIKNPAPYIELAWYRYVQKPIIWPLQVWWYRNVLLPRIIKRVSKKKRIKVLFLAMSVAYWKYDTVYRRMASDSRFEPVIMPAMRTNQSFEDQIKDHDELMLEFSKRGYNIVRGYDEKTKRFIAPQSLGADIVFYTHPYSGPGRLRRKYDFWAMRRSLICYVPYFFHNDTGPELFNNPIQNLAWQVYYGYEDFRRVVCKVMDNKGANVKIVGYMLGEELGEINKAVADKAWRNDTRKRIIWAPHHSIDDDSMFRAGTFLSYFEFMQELAKRYSKEIMITFKPHPVLYSRLVGKWGRKVTDDYYSFWKMTENTQLQSGDYRDLFVGSDALIHDCGSFKGEYLHLNKPCMFLYRPDFIEQCNETGERALVAHYAGYSKEDIVGFIENVVLKGQDLKKNDRSSFFDKYLKTPNGKSFSENVVNEIIKGLGKD